MKVFIALSTVIAISTASILLPAPTAHFNFVDRIASLPQADKVDYKASPSTQLDLGVKDSSDSSLKHLFSSNNVSGFKKFVLSGQAQGSTFSVQYYSTDSLISRREVNQLLSEVDLSLSLWTKNSLINRFNNSKVGLTIDRHLLTVLTRSQEISRATNGLFDCTVQPLVEAWGFSSRTVRVYPDSLQIRSLLKCVGYQKLVLEKKYLRKAAPCLKVDLNGIAQGYTVDLFANLLESKRIENYLVELGGEIRIKGRRQPDGMFMKIGIEAPGDDELERSIIQRTISMESGAVTTSGNYRKYHQEGGRFITHIINPKTGYPVVSNIISVTVVAKDAITADGYDNALLAMGLEKALSFLNHHSELAAYFIYRTSDGKVSDTATTNFKPFLNPIGR